MFAHIANEISAKVFSGLTANTGVVASEAIIFTSENNAMNCSGKSKWNGVMDRSRTAPRQERINPPACFVVISQFGKEGFIHLGTEGSTHPSLCPQGCQHGVFFKE